MDLKSTRKLNNGTEIPLLGLGVYLSKDGQETVDAVKWAIEAGYRHIDTAAVYHNEESVGKGILESGIDRKKLFVTTKLWNTDMREGRQREAFEQSLRLLRLDYVDLYLIHWPVENFQESWKILEEIYASGRAKAIGVSNFKEHHLEELMRDAKIIPAINQIESHPLLTQKPLIEYCEKHGILCEAWSPLGGTGGNLLENPVLNTIAKKYEKSTAQVILRWNLQRGVIAIPKSVHQSRIQSNTELYDFALSSEDVAAIEQLNRNQRVGPDPDCIDF